MLRALVKCFGFGIAALALASTLASAAYGEDLSGAAYSTCQMFALDQLHKSNGIHFPGLGEPGTGSRIPEGWSAGHYQVLSFVDSSSAAGLQTRSRLYCELRSIGNDRWVLDRMVIDDSREAMSINRPRSAAAPRVARP